MLHNQPLKKVPLVNTSFFFALLSNLGILIFLFLLFGEYDNFFFEGLILNVFLILFFAAVGYAYTIYGIKQYKIQIDAYSYKSLQKCKIARNLCLFSFAVVIFFGLLSFGLGTMFGR